MDADHIVVLERGQVREQGTHQTLLEAEGTYHGLWDKQFPTRVLRRLAA